MDEYILSKITMLNKLAGLLHQNKKQASEYTFSSLKEHVNEVKILMHQKQDHWKAETVDILIHALMLLDRYNVHSSAIEDLMKKRLYRFEEKIKAAIEKK